MSKIAVDFGHGVGLDRGADGFINEESLIDTVGPLVVAGLRAQGHNVLEVRPSSASSVSDALNKRSAASNNFGADLFVSIHANASNGQGHGTEVWTYGGKRLDQAVNVCNNIAALGFSNRGIKDGSHLAVVRSTSAPAMLIEVCFIDNQGDVNLYNSVGAQTIANCIISGITGSVPASAPAPTPTSSTTTSTSTTVNSEPRYWVGRLQQVCCWNGFTVAVDNWYGDKTDAAVKQLPLSGKPYTNKDATRFIQERLGISVDGVFWNATDTAVRNWQSSHGLVVDGIVGYNTYRSLALQD